MFFRVVGNLGILALSVTGVIVVLTAVVQIAGIFFPGLVPNFSNEPVLTK